MLKAKLNRQSGIPFLLAFVICAIAPAASDAQPRTAPARPAALTQFTGADFYKNFPAIASMTAPAGWYISPPARSKRGIIQQLKPTEKTKEAIDFFIEEIDSAVLPVSADELLGRQAVMKRPDHVMTPLEIFCMPELMSEFNKKSADPYKVTRCRTINLKGKRTIVIEGDGAANQFSDESKVISLMVDTSGTCKKMTIFTFSAEAPVFNANVKKVLDSIDTIKWK